MNPTYVHLIYEYGGEYEDAYETVIAVFYSEECAIKYLELMTKQEANKKEFAHELYKLGDIEGSYHEDRSFRLEACKVCDWDAEEEDEDEYA